MLVDYMVWELRQGTGGIVSFLDVYSLVLDDLNNAGPEQLRWK